VGPLPSHHSALAFDGRFHNRQEDTNLGTGNLFYLSPLCSVFTVLYVKQSIFLGYIVMQLFCITIC